MPNNTFKVSRSDKTVKMILAATFPAYKGRKIVVESATEVNPYLFADGGTLGIYAAYNLATGKGTQANTGHMSPYESRYHQPIQIPTGTAIVEHLRYCGYDCGIRIFIRPENLTPALTAAP